MSDTLLTEDWVNQLLHYHRIYVGYSGGLDSTVLLHHLASQPTLIKRLVAVHCNHQLSTNASQWSLHCQQQCVAWDVVFHSQTLHFERHANTEANARAARYGVFASLLTHNDALVLAHHRDDQAETLLLQLLRGAGVDGLAAMLVSKPVGAGTLLRPFLEHTREALQAYAMRHHLQWVEDESNDDTVYARNYLRRQIMPLLTTRWPQAVRNIARTAGHCQHAVTNLAELAYRDCPALCDAVNVLPLKDISELTLPRMGNVLRFWLKKNKVRVLSAARLNDVIQGLVLARLDAVAEVEWDGNVLRRFHNSLYLEKKLLDNLPRCLEWKHFPEPLELNDVIGFLGVQRAREGIHIPPNTHVLVRFRQGGETLRWHKQTKQLKKLWQAWQVPPWRRDRIPLLYLNGQLAAVVGYAIDDAFYQENGEAVYQIVAKNAACKIEKTAKTED